MKKIFIIPAILGGLILILFILGRLTGTLQYYKIPTPANEPTLKIGDRFLISNLKDPAPYKFIAFLSPYADSVNTILMPDAKFVNTLYLYRLCGVGGDTLEMKDGVLFINNKNFDENLNLNKQYQISRRAFETLIEEEDKPGDNNYYQSVSNDSIIVTFDRLQVKKYQSKLRLTAFIVRDTANGPFKWLNKNAVWTPDNFGPLLIPKGFYFALGDNRHNAFDSRYSGFILSANIKGVVLNK